MQQQHDQAENRTHVLDYLAVIANEEEGEPVRLAAIRALQKTMVDTNPLRHESPEFLLERVKPAWGTRRYLTDRHGVERTVTRPPVTFADVW